MVSSINVTDTNVIEKEQWPIVFQTLIVTNTNYWLSRVRTDISGLSNEYPQIFKCLQYALELPTAWSSAQALILAFNSIIIRQGLGKQWEILLCKAIQCSRAENDVVEIELRIHLATLYRLQGTWAEANECLQVALVLSQKQERVELCMIVLVQKALVARRNAEHETAMNYCRHILNNHNAPLQTRAEALNVMGLIAYDQHEPEGALGYFEDSLRYYNLLNDPYQEGRVFNNRGITLRKMGDLDGAEASYHKAILKLQIAEDQIEICKVRMNLGNIAWLRSDFKSAIEQYQLVLPIFKQTHYLLDRAHAYHNLAMSYSGLSIWDKSEHCFQLAIELYEALNDLDGLVNALDNLAEMYIHIDNFIQARSTWLQALDALKLARTTPINVKMYQAVRLTLTRYTDMS